MSVAGVTNNDSLRRVFKFANVVLRHRWIVIGLPIVAGALSVFLTTRRQRTYTSTATFMTQSGSRPPTTGLAAQFGINLGASDPSLSPEFYADLLRSRPVLERTARTEFLVPSEDSVVRSTLVQYYRGEDRAIDKISAGITTAIRPRTGVVVLATRSETAQLAQQIGRELLRQLDEFNQRRRKSRIGAERQFTEARLSEAAAELRASEDVLQDFYTRNRDFERSPELRFREDRLTREIARRQAVYATLAQAFEQAKIDEVRDTPVITVLEEPVLPSIGDARHTIDKALLAIALALLVAVGLAFVLDSLKRTKTEEIDELSELRLLGREFLHEVRNPVRTARRVFS
jgi:uncharacterized protein involved in exopolysaccharide biosynthesis